jgi:hypothetical protein
LDLLDELRDVSSALEAAGIPCAVVGGLAYSIYVEPRATEDLDLLIRPEDWERCIDALRPLGWEALAAPMDFKSIRIRRLTKFLPDSALVCDFLLADGALAEGVTHAHRIVVKGTTLSIAPPRVIIALKQARMSEKDRGDIEGLEKFIRDQGL